MQWKFSRPILPNISASFLLLNRIFKYCFNFLPDIHLNIFNRLQLKLSSSQIFYFQFFSFCHEFKNIFSFFSSLRFVRSFWNFIRRLSMLRRYLFSFCLFKAKNLLTKKYKYKKPWKAIWRWANEMARNAAEILISHCPTIYGSFVFSNIAWDCHSAYSLSVDKFMNLKETLPHLKDTPMWISNRKTLS